jgi:hypothetical protein
MEGRGGEEKSRPEQRQKKAGMERRAGFTRGCK